MVAAAFLFATMGLCIKHASTHFNTAEILFYRGLIGLAVVWVVMASQGTSLRTRHPWMHAWRSGVGLFSMGGWFYAIGQLPLASAMTLNYMSSIWMATFLLVAALWTWRPGSRTPRQPLNLPLVAAILVGFVGVVLMLQPSFSQAQSQAALTGLLSGVFAAMAYMQVVNLSRVGEPESRTVFFFALGTAAGGAVWMAVAGISPWPGIQAALWLVPVGVCAAGGQLCMTRAYASSTTARGTLVVANLQYTGIIFAGIYSLLWFEDDLGLAEWVGMALIAISGIAATILRKRGDSA